MIGRNTIVSPFNDFSNIYLPSASRTLPSLAFRIMVWLYTNSCESMPNTETAKKKKIPLELEWACSHHMPFIPLNDPIVEVPS